MSDVKAGAGGGNAAVPATSVSGTYRVTSVLYALTQPGEGLSVRAVAEATSTSRSATHRILQSLVDEGYAVQGEGGRYTTGPRMLQLAARTFTRATAIRLADAVMTGLVDDVNETAYLGTFFPEDMVVTFVHRVECSHPLRYIQQLGVRLPMDRGAIGKAILAEASPSLEAASSGYDDLSSTLSEIRDRGYAVTHSERVEGVTGVAAAIRTPRGVVGGLTIAMPTVRFDKDTIDSLGRKVKQHADQISEGMSALGANIF